MHKKDIINLFGIQENLVKKVKRSEISIDFYVETKSKVHCCPSCRHYTNHVHDYRIQKIQHITIGKVTSYIFLKKRRYVCPFCNKKFYESYNFLTRYFRKSNSVFNNVVEDLKTLKNFKTIAKDNHISIPTVTRYMYFASIIYSKYNINTLPESIGIDEFKGNAGGTKYLFHIFDLKTHKTIDIVESRKYDVLETYFSKFSSNARKNVKYVSMDLYRPFKRIIQDKFINATIIADCFHFTRIVSNTLDELRLRIWRNTKGNEKKYFKYLKLSLLKDMTKLKEKEYDKLLYSFDFSPILKYGYKLYQEFLNIKKLTTFEEKEKAFERWILDAETSTIPEFAKPVKTLREWHQYISNSFKYNLSNGPTEGKNNLIKVIKRISFGFRNFNNFKYRILMLNLD